MDPMRARDHIRLAYVIDGLDPSGGAEQSLAAVAPHYVERDIDLTVISLKDRDGLHDRIEKAGGRTIALGCAGTRPTKVRHLIPLFKQLRPDIVHTTLFEADIAGRIAGAAVHLPVVSSLVNDAYGSGHLGDPGISTARLRAAQCVDALTARFVRRFHAITTYVARAMSSRLRIPLQRIDVVPRGRDSATLGDRTPSRRREARTSLGISEEPLILVAARHERQKGIDVLLDAVPIIREAIPNVRVVIAGRVGNGTAQLERQVAQLDLSSTVTFLGRRQDVADLLCGADVLVMPSRWEGLGGVLLEAMCLQTPIVASDLPSIREALKDGETAILVQPEDEVALAQGLVNVLTDGDAASRRARVARQRFADRFDMSGVADQMRAFYDRALAGTR